MNAMPAMPTALLDALVPDATVPAADPADGYTLVDQPIVGGVPFAIPLDAELRAVLVMPTGHAVRWRDADPGALVTWGADELAPVPPASTATPSMLAPLRLLMQRNGVTVAVVPMTLGRVLVAVPDADAASDGAGVRLELVVLGWELRAGSLRGPGDVGSRVTFAWRRADRATAQFSSPPVDRYVAQRLPEADRLESAVGVSAAAEHPAPELPSRFRRKKVIRR